MKRFLPLLMALLLLFAGCVDLAVNANGDEEQTQTDVGKANEENWKKLAEKVERLEGEVEELKERLGEMEGRLEEVKEENETPIVLEGDVEGALNETRIKEGVITPAHIKDGSIGREDINTSQIQVRVSGACKEGFIISIDENGNVECGNVEMPEIPEYEAPTIEEVLKEGNDAEGKSIVGLETVESESISAETICLNGDCVEKWEEIKGSNFVITSQEFSLHQDDPSNERTVRLGEFDYCALSEVAPRHSEINVVCRVYLDNDKWYLTVKGGKCSAICFNLEKEQ